MKSITDSLSLQELIAVLLPGALAVFFMAIGWYGPEYIETIYKFIKEDWTNAFAFFGAAYFIGYVVYVMSSCLDSKYDKIKRWALKLDEEVKGEVNQPTSRIVNCLFPNLLDTHKLITVIVEFKNKEIGIEFDGHKHQIIDAYQFAFRWLMKKKPEMYEEAERYLATARFFRSMVFVWAFGAIIWAIRANLAEKWYTLIFAALSIVSFFTFLNRWRKAHHIAFKNVIILEGLKKDTP